MPFFVSRPDRLAGFRAGREDVLTELYLAYFEQVAQIIRHGYLAGSNGLRVSGVPAADVADLVQEVFARAFRESARHSYDGVRQYGPFLYAIARNVLSDRGRKVRREPAGSVNVEDFAVQGTEGPWADEAVLRVVEEYLNALPPKLRGVHEQRYERGLGQVEAAAALGLTRQQLRTLERKLRAGLQSALRRAKIELK